MGRSTRPIPDRLGEKLYFIRRKLGFTQQQMVDRLQSGLDPTFDKISLYSGHISEYERGVREPPLRVLLEYARIAQVPLEILADTWMQLPGQYISLMFIDRILKDRKAREFETSRSGPARIIKTQKKKPKKK